MKKSRFSVVALAAILFAAGSAFTGKIIRDTKSAKETSFYWFKAGVYQRLATKTAEQPMSGCSGSGNNCELAYDASQLNNPSQPSQGVKTTQTSNNRDVIPKN